ncbi:serine/threonine-protein kinase [Actinomadura flavalba]|uniref:serine/threonine-protein kinase n=1 Tax=Actinomadura flavalba TaxID=1120938 RepID=UPI00146E90CB|nr:serine/threonine-protein kinase [Actinomadura flavalba]
MGHEGSIPLAQRYRLLSAVGRGGMGTVWRARDEVLEREVAVKEVRLPHGLPDGERRLLCRRLIAEAKATAALNHPGVVAVHDVIVEDERPWIVMEFVRARSLHEVIVLDGPLEPRRAAEIGLDVLGVLTAAHEAGILHRDVKPSNILICDDGRVLLTDFGLATHMADDTEIEDTLVAGIEGSPAYLAPERVRGEAGDECSDLWSFGATLYAMVEGVSPFARSHALASMLAVLLDEQEPPEHAGPLAPVIGALLTPEPDDRPGKQAVRQLLTDVATAPEPAPEVPWQQRLASEFAGRLPRTGAMASVAVLAVAVVVLGAWSARWNSVGQSDAAAVKAVQASATKSITYREAAGYTVDVPTDWTRAERGGGVQWNDPSSGTALRITPAQGDAIGGLRAAEAATAKERPAFRTLRLEPVPGDDRDVAEWEYTWRGADGVTWHALHSRVPGYEFAFSAPDARWTPGQRVHDQILRTFRADG